MHKGGLCQEYLNADQSGESFRVSANLGKRLNQ